MSTRNARRSTSIAVAIAVVAIAAIIPIAPSGADHTLTASVSGIFESNDGNLVLDHTGQTPAEVDWNSFWTRDENTNPPTSVISATGTAWNFEQFGDAVGNPDTIFGGGVKQDAACPATKSGSLGGGGSKFDLERVYLAHKEIGGDDFLFLAWVRVPQSSTTASSHVAFEFNQSDEDCSSTNDLKQRSPGDTLIVYDFEGGSANPTIKVLRWLDGDYDATAACEVAGARPCWGDAKTLAASGADGKVNIASVGPVYDGIADETLGVVEFGEAGIDLADAGITDPCDISGYVTGVSRSSGNSGTAQMKDRVGPGEFTLPQCVATTSIQSNITLRDSATVVGFVAGGDNTGTAGDVTFELYGPEDADCDGFLEDGVTAAPLRYSETVKITNSGTGAGTASTTGGYTVPADELGTVNEGVYNWVVTFTANNLNLGSASACGSEVADVQYDFSA